MGIRTPLTASDEDKRWKERCLLLLDHRCQPVVAPRSSSRSIREGQHMARHAALGASTCHLALHLELQHYFTGEEVNVVSALESLAS